MGVTSNEACGQIPLHNTPSMSVPLPIESEFENEIELFYWGKSAVRNSSRAGENILINFFAKIWIAPRSFSVKEENFNEILLKTE